MRNGPGSPTLIEFGIPNLCGSVQYLHKALKKLAGDKELVSNQLISGRLAS